MKGTLGIHWICGWLFAGSWWTLWGRAKYLSPVRIRKETCRFSSP